jgi:hypothetical protein
MQFITEGPDLPEALLQAHEEGRVVFFCGAGISYPAGLPCFKGLVEEIYRLNGTAVTDIEIEREAFDREQFDATLDLLERRLPGQRMSVRRALAQALSPKLRRRGATDTQAALLRLARSREGALRLVTTNFDRVFHTAAKRTGQSFKVYAAPMLPIPKSSRWNGLVYLHCLLPDRPDDTALNQLVVTSGDFGLAYLTERWAARFVSELFRNYVVCFVGYSINDPVMRYMMDALAADRMLGEVTLQAWALGDCEPGQERRKTREWEAKASLPSCTQCAPAATTIRHCIRPCTPGQIRTATAFWARSASWSATLWHGHRPVRSKTISSAGCCGPCQTNRAYRQNALPTSTPSRRSTGWWKPSRTNAFSTAIWLASGCTLTTRWIPSCASA